MIKLEQAFGGDAHDLFHVERNLHGFAELGVVGRWHIHIENECTECPGHILVGYDIGISFQAARGRHRNLLKQMNLTCFKRRDLGARFGDDAESDRVEISGLVTTEPVDTC